MIRAVLVAVVLALATACGVSTEDAPEVIDDSSTQPPEPTPSVDTSLPRTTSPSPVPRPTGSVGAP